MARHHAVAARRSVGQGEEARRSVPTSRAEHARSMARGEALHPHAEPHRGARTMAPPGTPPIPSRINGTLSPEVPHPNNPGTLKRGRACVGAGEDPAEAEHSARMGWPPGTVGMPSFHGPPNPGFWHPHAGCVEGEGGAVGPRRVLGGVGCGRWAWVRWMS